MSPLTRFLIAIGPIVVLAGTVAFAVGLKFALLWVLEAFGLAAMAVAGTVVVAVSLVIGRTMDRADARKRR